MQMGRSYVRKSTRGSWCEESMQQAMLALDQGMPLKTCAAQFNVPRNTLRRHWTKKLKKQPGCTHLGRQSILGPSVEKDLIDYIMNLEEKGFGLTPTDVRELAFDYAERNNIPHTFDKELKAAGLDWWSGFRLCHRTMLSIRKPEALSLARAAAMNKPAITKYFDILEREMQRLGITNKPSCIYNCDESGLSLVPDTCRVVARKGKRNVYQVTSAERGVLTTVLPCYNAAGYYVPPMIVYKGKRVTDGLKKDMPDGTRIAMSDTGYMNMDLFQTWLEHFKKNLQEPNSPALLILDGHGSHVKAIDGLKYAERNNISIVCLPPHTTHWTQPLDRCYFKPLKSNYAHECRKFMRDNPGTVITRYNFGKLFSAAYYKTSSMAVAVDSFRSTGIYPLNKDIFPDDVFAPSQTTDRELLPGDGQIPSTSAVSGGQPPSDGPQDQSAGVVSGGHTSSVVSGGQPPSDGPPIQSTCAVDGGQTSSVVDGEQPPSDGPPVQSSGVVSGGHTSSVVSGGQPPSDGPPIQSTGAVNGGHTVISSGQINRFELMKPLPKKDFNKKRKRRSSTTSRVLTSKKHISDLEEELRLSAGKSKKSKMQCTGGESKPKTACRGKKCPEVKTDLKNRKKKLKCREDKPRGRRPSKAIGADLQKKNKKCHDGTRGGRKVSQAKMASKTQTGVGLVCCAGCGELEDDSVEDWIACTQCQTWYELPCAGLLGKPRRMQDLFVCKECA